VIANARKLRIGIDVPGSPAALPLGARSEAERLLKKKGVLNVDEWHL
jgi:hypothetical protein